MSVKQFELFTCSFYSPELKGLGADFVFGFVQSMDGERDPRNLVLAFQIANNIIHRGYDLGEQTHVHAHAHTHTHAHTPPCLPQLDVIS